jgi:chitin synthase
MQRLTDPYAENGGHSPVMHPHYTDNRTPSPGRPLQPYQHGTEFQPLQMPSTDHLLDQPTVRLTHVLR